MTGAQQIHRSIMLHLHLTPVAKQQPLPSQDHVIKIQTSKSLCVSSFHQAIWCNPSDCSRSVKSWSSLLQVPLCTARHLRLLPWAWDSPRAMEMNLPRENLAPSPRRKTRKPRKMPLSRPNVLEQPGSLLALQGFDTFIMEDLWKSCKDSVS